MSRGVLPTVMRRSRNFENEVMARVGPQRHRGNKININNKNKNALEIHTDSPTAQVTVQMLLLLYL